ncbi:hypothetical protein UO65_4951 [Actinokineospora spheciospongiae]|uniref:Uncharacterized protein n=1 Tax=Actinokineospora spheciospongiae TaxID=909613 RepID=W7IHK8_9PSEU|nr:hypothetical protein [Actinokineospora spheciospongiae]EWC59808.1 hypothetical protein UO65_4951 [Actinokineospora spheciospongiae]
MTAKNPNASYMPGGHISNGSKPGFKSQYISTTNDMGVLKKWNQGRAVEIDLDKFGGWVVDASTQAARDRAGIRGATANRLAENSKEVLLEGFIPPGAIRWLGKV